MGHYLFKNAKFIKTAIKPRDYAVMRDLGGNILPEIAVAGRSNVGKSTLLNHLFQSKGLVKTSSTPGKTQAINFFTLNDQIGFVDLPGYGYASVPPSVRKKWGPMVQSYLETREPLSLILLLFDIRRKPNQDDLQLLDWIAHNEIPMLLILTKVDKVKTNEKKKNTKIILETMGYEEMPYIYYSATKNVGRKELIYAITDHLEESNGQN